jgi:hypothetical protein
MEKRYQVFVSSTYADLKEERQKVIQALMEMDCIPAGMELFPAADEEQFEFIKHVINDCDYYLLIIGGRYGTISPEGISYTEQEYDYAVSQGIRVVALIHESPENIPLGKSELDPAARILLEAFKKKVSTNRLVKFWKEPEELPGLVALSLSKTIKLFPAIGWVRANRVSSEEILSEINNLRKANNDLTEKVKSNDLTPNTATQNIAGLDETFEMNGYFTGPRGRVEWAYTATWGTIFSVICPYLMEQPNTLVVKSKLEDHINKENNFRAPHNHLDDQDFQTIAIQLKALKLVKIDNLNTTNGGRALFWSATSLGEKLTYELRTIRTKSPS